jgi:hypothetical protein
LVLDAEEEWEMRIGPLCSIAWRVLRITRVLILCVGVVVVVSGDTVGDSVGGVVKAVDGDAVGDVGGVASDETGEMIGGGPVGVVAVVVVVVVEVVGRMAADVTFEVIGGVRVFWVGRRDRVDAWKSLKRMPAEEGSSKSWGMWMEEDVSVEGLVSLSGFAKERPTL